MHDTIAYLENGVGQLSHSRRQLPQLLAINDSPSTTGATSNKDTHTSTPTDATTQAKSPTAGSSSTNPAPDSASAPTGETSTAPSSPTSPGTGTTASSSPASSSPASSNPTSSNPASTTPVNAGSNSQSPASSPSNGQTPVGSTAPVQSATPSTPNNPASTPSPGDAAPVPGHQPTPTTPGVTAATALPPPAASNSTASNHPSAPVDGTVGTNNSHPLLAPNVTNPVGAPVAASNSSARLSDSPVTSTITQSYTGTGPLATGAFRSPATHKQQSSQNDSSGLSSGAITGIAIVAGIVGFILLFWIGVQMLQSKRRRREEADMQEIDFDPSGAGSAHDDTLHALGISRNPSTGAGNGSSAYSGKQNPRDLAETQYDDDTRMYADYAPSLPPPPPNMAGIGGVSRGSGDLQRQPTVGGMSVFSNHSTGPTPQGYYAADLHHQPSYPLSSAHGQYVPSTSRFDPGRPMPPYAYEYGAAHGHEGSDYHGDPHNNAGQGSAGLGYGNMIARSTSPPPPPSSNFHYPPNQPTAL